MRVLVIGSGAREHALASRIAAEPGVTGVVAAPGNPGIARVAQLASVQLTDAAAMLALAEREQIDLTIVGPELPLSVGVADRFADSGRAIVGPTVQAAALETSKAFAKRFMERHHIPTARFRVCSSEQDAIALVRSNAFGFPIVIKADGLAAGKGVVIATDRQEAEYAIVSMMRDGRFGDAGRRVVVEECLVGPEVSFFALSDGEHALALGTAQDHKRIGDDDRGPNTGGMGAFAESPLIDRRLHERIMETIVRPVISGMHEDGNPYRGFLYAGLMLTADGPKVIEFNVRLGDPEAQVILPLIAEPLLPLLASAASGALRREPAVRIAPEKIVGVVLASAGYPEKTDVGTPIHGVADAERLSNVAVFHAGTALRGDQLVTNGGRVLTVIGRGATFETAIERAYEGVSRITFAGMQYRRDIGRKALVSSEAADSHGNAAVES